jgi:predicted RNase H-like HicB family nuclease
MWVGFSIESMSRARQPDDGEDTEVTVSRDGDWFVALDEETGVASQGKTRPEALANLAEALRIHEEPVSEDIEAGQPNTPWFDE